MFNFGLSPTEAELALMEFERRKREEWEKKHPVQAYIERRKAKKAYEKMCKRREFLHSHNKPYRKERFKSNGYEYHRSSGYGRTSFYLEPYTEERGRQVIQENKRKCMVGWLKEFDYTKLSYEEAEQVYTLVAGLKNS